jgi:hypothetical protein
MAAAPASNQRPPARSPAAGWTELRCDSVCPRSGHVALGQPESARMISAPATSCPSQPWRKGKWLGRPPLVRFISLRQRAAGRARHSVRAAPATSDHWIFRAAACQSYCPKDLPRVRPSQAPPFQFTAVPSRFVTPNRIKSNFFAPVHFAPAPARPNRQSPMPSQLSKRAQ